MLATPYASQPFAGRKRYGRFHCLNETNDELQLPVPLGNHVQGEADGSVIAMEPMGIRPYWGLPFVREMGLTLRNGILRSSSACHISLRCLPSACREGFLHIAQFSAQRSTTAPSSFHLRS